MKKIIIGILLLFCFMALFNYSVYTRVGDRQEIKENNEIMFTDYPPTVMVEGELYQDMGYVNGCVKCDTADGEITSSVDGSKLPEKDNESNFGTGYEYQLWDDAHINVKIDDKWVIFQNIAISSWTIPDEVAHFTATVIETEDDNLLATFTEKPDEFKSDEFDWLLGKFAKPMRIPIDNLEHTIDGKTVTTEGLKDKEVEIWFDGSFKNTEPEKSCPSELGEVYKIKVITE